ncbi:MAG: threonine synthase [Firmicutes bacterium]|nr:threonine synthase [Bacillota bacterium]
MGKIFYHSTRGDSRPVSAAEAIVNGIAADGGLYVPNFIPQITKPLVDLVSLSYQELALEIMQLYLPDFSAAELESAIGKAYDEKFATPEIAPLVTHAGTHFLELYHGPTLAFKDMALSILPHLLRLAADKCGIRQEVVILTATSGDTGKAALAGFANVPATKIIVFFPEDGVSPIQKRQMVTQEGDNTYVVGIEGNFDDAQSGVKDIFTDEKLKEKMLSAGYIFSSANSINIGRLIPQIIYYFYAYLRLLAGGAIKAGESINFVVPTGNFGNILAAYYAGRMGLPIAKLICASNRNKVLYDFFTTGVYDKERKFYVTISPSMDILISSNLERLLYHASGEDSQWVKKQMQALQTKGRYSVPPVVQKALSNFVGGYATEAETRAAIKTVYEETNYLLDPHTAVAYSVLQKYRAAAADIAPTVVVATASPYKFAKDVLTSLDDKYEKYDDFSLLQEMAQLSAQPLPQAVKELEKKSILHTKVCRKEEMRALVENILGL